MKSLYQRPSKPLPPNDYKETGTRTAYDRCLWLEKFESWAIFVDQVQQTRSEELMNDMPLPVVARVLGYGMRCAPNERGRDALVRDILACERDVELLAGVALRIWAVPCLCVVLLIFSATSV